MMKREVWVDWMRVLACFMVMVVHSTEPFYLGGDGNLVLTRADVWWSAFFDSAVRCCVPLFVVASSYLQFPIHYSTGEFFRRRAVRIIVPFLFWTVIYALVWGSPVQNFKDLLLNFNYAAGHLWFVYMILGLYLLMPLLSPWAERVGKRELRAYLILCFATTLIPLVRSAAGGPAVVIYGPGGIPNSARYPLWGEACWNAYGIFYYLCGFVGYMLFGLYLRKFGGSWSVRKSLTVGIPVWIAGFAITFLGFVRRALASSAGSFPIPGDEGVAAEWETTWQYDSTGVALMTIGLMLILRHIKAEGGFYRHAILPVSKAGYGMYLCHMLVLSAFSGLWRGVFGIGTDAALGVWTTPVEVILTAVCSFICVSAVSVIGQKIPKAGRLIFG